MSSGGIFTLLANDGKADRMIMATEFLRTRIKQIMCQRAQMGMPDPTPTLVDIEKTHILFVNAHFKPYAACGFEYSKVRPNSGDPQWGQDTQWNIPQFGDFFNDMVVNVTINETQASLGTVPAFPPAIGDSDITEPSTTTGEEEIHLYKSVSAFGIAKVGAKPSIYKRYTYEYVNFAGVPQKVGSPARNFIRYCEYPGCALFSLVKFDVNGNPLDEYNTNTYVFHQKYKVQPNKLLGWMRCMGQEIPKNAVSDISSVSGSSAFSSDVVDLLNSNGVVAPGAPVSATNTTRKTMQVLDGPQTPKVKQSALELWIPLLFWFNKNPKLSIPSVSIPYGQRFITTRMARIQDILYTAPGDLFLRLTTEVFVNGGDEGAKTATNIKKYTKTVVQTPVLVPDSVIDPNTRITGMDLYINNIFVNGEIHDIYIKRIGFSLIRVHRMQTIRVTESNSEKLLSSLKWPVETMYVALRPAFNQSVQNPNKYKDWHRHTAFEEHTLETLNHGDSAAFDSASTIAGFVPVKSTYVSDRWTYSTNVATVDEISIKAQSVPIYNQFKSRFFQDYVPLTYGGDNITVPEDTGNCMINFCFYPGTYQPSGHINISRTREFYLGYHSSYCDASHPCDIIVEATAINFLLITDGNAILRYTT